MSVFSMAASKVSVIRMRNSLSSGIIYVYGLWGELAGLLAIGIAFAKCSGESIGRRRDMKRNTGRERIISVRAKTPGTLTRNT